MWNFEAFVHRRVQSQVGVVDRAVHCGETYSLASVEEGAATIWGGGCNRVCLRVRAAPPLVHYFIGL